MKFFNGYIVIAIKTLVLAVMIFGLNSCGGDTPSNTNNNNNNNETSDFFPLEIGSWWKYKVSFDPTSDQYSIDSTVLESKKLVNGKDAFMFLTYIKNKDTHIIELTDTSYYYKEGPKIYRLLSNYMSKEKEWQLYADLQLEYIKIFEYPVTIDIDAGSILKGVQKKERVVEGPEKFYLGETTINCIKTRVISTLEGEITYSDKSTAPYFEIYKTEYQWFGYNVGFVKVYWLNDDYVRILLDYHIEKK